MSAAGFGIEPTSLATGRVPGADHLRVYRPGSSRVARPPAAVVVPAPRRGTASLLFRVVRAIVVFAVWASIGVVAALGLAVGGPVLVGGQPLIVRSGSMEPLIHTGDLVVVRTIAPDAIQIGDVVTFPHPDGSGRLLTHRVRDLAFESGIAHVTTKGDAVTGREQWDVPLHGSIGRVEYRVSKAGYVIAWFKSPAALLAAGVAAALALTAWVLAGIWRSES